MLRVMYTKGWRGSDGMQRMDSGYVVEVYGTGWAGTGWYGIAADDVKCCPLFFARRRDAEIAMAALQESGMTPQEILSEEDLVNRRQIMTRDLQW